MYSEVATSMDQLENAIESDGAVLVVFSKAQCPACVNMDNWLEKQFSPNNEHSPIRLVKAKLEDIGRQAVEDFGLRTMPTTLLFKGGDEVYRVAGFTGPAPVEAAINAHLTA